ncbi:MAG: bifunctional hydroxymethylpyrimidine kinase/phosphomethylpyrimidine kinase [Mariprofundaceae bacterium]|nr:bifunctional hydroxymethylpyrimidine kinase/phosphomethylpyrimidine kinase [Mariprofundaceae bacterium]
MEEGLSFSEKPAGPAACLAIGGSDSCAGAGIQADLQTFSAFGIKGCSAITALTAQNPDDISRIEPVPLAQLEAEIRAVFDYYDVKAVKTGMLYDRKRVELVVSLLNELHAGKPVVADPVMVSSSGKRLLDEDAVTVMKQKLFPIASLITPNVPEAELLLHEKAGREASARLFRKFSAPVLLKGGHIRGERLLDQLYVDGEEIAFPHQRQPWSREKSHGTGCRLASAITASLAKGASLSVAVSEAIGWLQNS